MEATSVSKPEDLKTPYTDFTNAHERCLCARFAGYSYQSCICFAGFTVWPSSEEFLIKYSMILEEKPTTCTALSETTLTSSASLQTLLSTGAQHPAPFPGTSRPAGQLENLLQNKIYTLKTIMMT